MDLTKRIESLQQLLKKMNCDALVIDDKTNLFYLTGGMELSAGKLLIHTKGVHLFVDSRYFEMCQKLTNFPCILDTPSAFATFLSSEKFSFIQNLAFDKETTPYKTYDLYQKLSEEVTSLRPNKSPLHLVGLDAPLTNLRAIKDLGEQIFLREAASLGSQGFDYVCTLLKEGITEAEVACELEIFWKRKGGKSVAFDPIIAFGTNSSMPHHRAGKTKLKAGDIVLVDIGVVLHHYHSDMTRIAFYGKPTPLLLSLHDIVKKAQQAALTLCFPGTMISDLDKAARDVISSFGYGENFTHSLGHGVGLDIHELPTIRDTPPLRTTPLKAGMVITIEPGIYLPGVGGIRIEDTVIINENGHENLTLRSPEPVFLDVN